jgi:hypothetical protein
MTTTQKIIFTPAAQQDTTASASQNREWLTPEHIEILKHTRDRAAGGYYCGDSVHMQQLVESGLMAYAGRKSFVHDPYFEITQATF